jgi:predicted SAM-dependent methyltransferase
VIGPSTLRKVVRRYDPRKRRAQVTEGTPRRLHVGCGDVHIDGWCNVDIDARTGADVVDDITALEKFPDRFAETVYACHVLEHVSHEDVARVLRTWHRVLAPRSTLYISVPDLDRIVRIYAANWEHFQTRPNAPWIGLIYGGQLDRFDFHRTGFNLCWMTELLERGGFGEVQEYPHEPHPFGIRDASLANQPFGEFISLNVKATRL